MSIKETELERLGSSSLQRGRQRNQFGDDSRPLLLCLRHLRRRQPLARQRRPRSSLTNVIMESTAPMRVLHVITDRDRRGAQVFAMDLAQGLDTLGVRNEVVALAPGQHGDLLPVECLGPSRRSLRTIRALRRRARA